MKQTLSLEQEPPVEYRYTVREIGNLGILDKDGDEIPAAVILGSSDAIRALGPVLLQPLAIRILLDLEEEPVSVPDELPPDPPKPLPFDLAPVWDSLFPGLDRELHPDGRLTHRCDNLRIDDEPPVLLTLSHSIVSSAWIQPGEFFRLSLKVIDKETGKPHGPPTIEWRPGEDGAAKIRRKLEEYIRRYQKGAECGREELTRGRWVSTSRVEDFAPVLWCRWVIARMG